MTKTDSNPFKPLDSEAWYPAVRQFSVGSKWIHETDHRFNASTYAQEVYLALRSLENCPFPKQPLSSFVGRVYHPTENQPRSNFKRIWVKMGEGAPFLTGKQLFFFRPDRDKFVSRRMPKFHELEVPAGSILLSRSGTTGFPILVGQWLAQFAVTDDAIRIFPGSAPMGYVYSYLASSICRPLMIKSEYGATVSHLEARHISTVPTPVLPQRIQDSCHTKISKAFALRDQANSMLDEAERVLHSLVGISPFSEDDIEYLADSAEPKAFAISSSDLNNRFDATNHVPIVRSVVHKLERGKFELLPLSKLCSTVYIPARFKRNYVEVSKGVPYLLPSQLPPIKPYGMKALSERQARQSPEYLLQDGHLLVTTDGTVGRVHPVTSRMVGWFASNNIARLFDLNTDMGFLYAFLATSYGYHQLRKDIYGGVVDHINENHIKSVLVPNVPLQDQKAIGELVRHAFANKDAANELEDSAITELEAAIINR